MVVDQLPQGSGFINMSEPLPVAGGFVPDRPSTELDGRRANDLGAVRANAV